jgi:hypothetical protein
MKAFFDMMDKDPRKVMILGGSCNSVTDSIAKTSKHWRIPVVSGEFIHFFRDRCCWTTICLGVLPINRRAKDVVQDVFFPPFFYLPY